MNNLQHQVWQLVKDLSLESKDKFILAVSGGLDSMVMLDIFLKIRPNAKLKVAHYHHGECADERTLKFRDDSLALVKHKIFVSNNANLNFVYEKSNVELKSELQMREARWNFFKRQRDLDGDVILTAHHLDDRLETFLIKMIRGTAIDGFDSFSVYQNFIFRPLLNFSKVEIKQYAIENQIQWIEDPTNDESDYLRNWLRNSWLPDLDKKSKGGSQNLAKSLIKIGQAINDIDSFELQLDLLAGSLAMQRTWYMSLSKADQLRAIAIYLKKHQLYNFTAGQLAEIRKRLDKDQKDYTFEMLDRKWVINATQVMIV